MKPHYLLTALLIACAAPLPALGQFDFGSEPEQPAWTYFKLNASARIKLDFRNASVDAVIRTLTEASGVPILKDPALVSTMTLQSPKPQSLKEAFALFNAALNLRNCDLKRDGTFLIIKMRAQRTATARLAQNGMQRMFGGQTGQTGTASQTVLKIYPIKYASATQVARVINEVFANLTDSTMSMPTMGPGGGGFPGGPGGGPGGGGPGGGGPPGTAAIGELDTTDGTVGVKLVGGQGPGGGGPGGFPGGGFPGGGFPGGGFPGGGFPPGMGGMGGGRNGSSSSLVKASAEDFSNSVIVSAPARFHDQIAKIIETVDKPSQQPEQSKVIKLKYTSASDLVTEIQNLLTSNAPRGRGGSSSSSTQTIDQRFQRSSTSQTSGGSVVADTHANALIVTAVPDSLAIVEKVIAEIDTPMTVDNGAYVVVLKNARADKVAQIVNAGFSSKTANTSTINNLISNSNTSSSSRTTSTSTSSSSPSSLSSRSASRAAQKAGASGGASGTETEDGPVEIAQGFGGGGIFGGFGGGGQSQGSGSSSSTSSKVTTGFDAEGHVVNVRSLAGNVIAIPDVNTNSVIIVTSPENRAIVDKILDQLDKIPEQVMIETLIVEASLDVTNKLGVEWNFTKGKSTATSAFGLAADTAQPQGLRYTLTGTQYGAFLQALQTDTRFEVLSTPRIFTSNNTTAEINISQSLPYVTSQREDSNGNLTYTYSFLDVGIVLTVTPRITSNGFVTMDVSQTANDFVAYTSFNAPIVNQRVADTTVSVKDGETIVLGGIIKKSLTNTVNKIPLLGDIPLIGNLFRTKSVVKNKTELLVFLTPRVVRDEKEARKLRERSESQLQPTTRAILEESKRQLDPDAKTNGGKKDAGEKKPDATAAPSSGDKAPDADKKVDSDKQP